jgi:hypothetical protein
MSGALIDKHWSTFAQLGLSALRGLLEPGRSSSPGFCFSHQVCGSRLWGRAWSGTLTLAQSLCIHICVPPLEMYEPTLGAHWSHWCGESAWRQGLLGGTGKFSQLQFLLPQLPPVFFALLEAPQEAFQG